MKRIVLFGADCGKCKKAEVNIKKAIAKSSLEITFEKIDDYEVMVNFDVYYLPTVMIDNVIVFKGVIPSENDISKLIV